jgi:hypothetical protein
VRWYCATCGAEHDDLPFDWHYDAPAYWDGPRAEGDDLTSDLCVWTDDDGARAYFIRGLLPIPVADADQVFNYGVWSTLSAASFERVLDLWDDPRRTEEPPYFGYLSNAIADFPDTLGLHVDVITAELEVRPRLVLHDADHPLVRAQRDGVTTDFVREVARSHLHS